jgi:tetratricopeptide (TPR) repeat protein
MAEEYAQFDVYTHEFDVAVSFPGEYRAYVNNVVDVLINTHKIKPDKIFYDDFYKPFLASLSLDTLLQDIYRKRSNLIVIFLCKKYQEKKWCGLEARAIRDLIKEGHNKKIMLIKMDDGEVDGFLAIDGWCDARKYEAAKIADFIHQRLTGKLVFPIFNSTSAVTPRVSVSNLPEKNPYFTGRKDKLEKIEAMFKAGGRVCLKQTIAGLGGVGKTQLALEYAHRYKNKYLDAVWWINAETVMTAFNGCLDFAQEYGFIQEGEDEARKLTPTKLGKQLKNWFTMHHSWLFIFDNVEQIEIIGPYILGVQTGHILITTRVHELKQGESVDIDFFTPGDAMGFMHTRLSKCKELISNETDLAMLAGRLDCFPLALEQAAAYMERTRICCSDYFDYLGKDGLKALKLKRGKPTNYPRAITETLVLSFDKLSRSAWQLFNLCAYMAPDKIPLLFFKRQQERLPQLLGEDLWDTYKLDDIVAELLNYSLVKRIGNFLNIHRLVQEIRRELLNGDKTDWLYICMEAVIAEMPADDGFTNQEQRERFEQIAAHGTVIAGYATKDAYTAGLAKKKLVGNLCYHLGLGYYYSAQYENALIWYWEALKIREAVLDKDHPDVARTYNNLGLVYYRQEDYAKALELYQKALEIYEKAIDKCLPDTATTYNNIAQLYSIQRDYVKALEWNYKALEIREKELGKKDPDTATTYNDIGLVYARQGHYAIAIEWYQKALIIYEKAEKPSYTAATYHNIAKAYTNEGDYAEALDWHYKALEIREMVNGKEHAYAAETYHGVGEVYAKQGDYTKALEYYYKALRIREKKLGKEHSHTVITSNAIAEINSR